MTAVPKDFLCAKKIASRQRGMTLVELMVSMTVGLILLAGMTTLLVNQNKTQVSLDKNARMIENGRFAMQLIADDLQVAGYYGALDTIGLSAPAVLPNPCTTPPPEPDAIVHVQGVNGIDAATVSVPAAWNCLLDVRNGTDVLVIRRAETKPVAAPSGTNSTFYFQASLCPKDTPKYVIHDSTFPMHDRDCDAIAPVQRMIVRIYFIANNNAAGDGIPTLKRAELNLSGSFDIVPLAEGIESMHFLYGLDYQTVDPATGAVSAGPDGIADAYYNCGVPDSGVYFPCDSATLASTVTMQVHLLTRTTGTFLGHTDGKTYTLGDQVLGPFNDARKRHVFSQFVDLVNKGR